MPAQGKLLAASSLLTTILMVGCSAKTVDFSSLQRPERAAELAAFDMFVGNWTWEFQTLNADEKNKSWSGTAKWEWTLDKRCLHGLMSAKSADSQFETAGIWTWHPKSKEYIWWMFNNWGYPQQGSACYDADKGAWTMSYSSVGLDGTTSYGEYRMTEVDADTLRWEMTEWADLLRMIKKVEMRGTYKRAR